MLTFLTAFIGSFFNFLRGRGYLSRVMFSAALSLFLFFLTYYPDYKVLPMMFIGILTGFSFGWGKYFMAIHGEDKRHEKEFLPADLILEWIEDKFGKRRKEFIEPVDVVYISDKQIDNKLYGTIGMGLRFSIGFLPMMLIFTCFKVDFSVSLLTLSMLLVGAIYYLSGRFFKDNHVRNAEVITGSYLTLMFYLASII